jgi:branched-chain amino acid transport system ATP-binding protein
MLLNGTGITSGYGKAEIIHGVDIAVDDGEIVTIIGPNGSGKSTLLKTIVGLVPCWDGTIQYKNEDITAVAPEKMVTKGICFVPQRNDIFPNLTVMENLQMGAWALEDGFEENLRDVFDIFPILEEFQDRQAEYLSGGQRRMLGIGSALMVDPDLLVLDEPSAGLAPDLVDDVFDTIDRINETGASILLAEQNARRALERSDRGMVLVMGEKRLEGTGTEVLDSPRIDELYIGRESQ